MCVCVRDKRLTWFQDLDDNSLVGQRVDALVHLGVLSSANFLDDLVVVLGSTCMIQRVSKGKVRVTYWNLTSKLS